MADSKNTAIDHMARQKKRKDLPDTMVYGSIKGIVEMHELGQYIVFKKSLGKHLEDIYEENKRLNERVDKAKETIIGLNNKVEFMERKLKEYGII